MTLTPDQKLSPGDYVLGTKYSDGEAWDPWIVGFYKGQCGDGRHQIADSFGNTGRIVYRRVENITADQGNYLLANADNLERYGAKLWDIIHEKGSSQC